MHLHISIRFVDESPIRAGSLVFTNVSPKSKLLALLVLSNSNPHRIYKTQPQYLLLTLKAQRQYGLDSHVEQANLLFVFIQQEAVENKENIPKKIFSTIMKWWDGGWEAFN